jgi:hypothetical protein
LLAGRDDLVCRQHHAVAQAIAADAAEIFDIDYELGVHRHDAGPPALPLRRAVAQQIEAPP